MTLQADARAYLHEVARWGASPGDRVASWLSRHSVAVVAIAAMTAAVARLPFLGRAPGPDEAGFLVVGGQWDGAGPSLYDSLWVDRPPLLITLFRASALAGGLPALRLLGCLVVVLTVVGVAVAARLIGERFLGDRHAARTAAAAAAVCAAAWSVNPLLGTAEVNGELLAAPFLAWGFVAVVLALRTPARGRAWVAAALAGALATGSLLIKQNLADVAVFGAIALVLAWIRHELTGRRLLDAIGGAVTGAVAAAAVAAWWTVLHGTSLVGVWQAMYPFRLRAARTMVAGGQSYADQRLHGMSGDAVLSGLALVLVVLVVQTLRRRHHDLLWWALMGTCAFGVASVLLGGNYWLHYQLELLPTVSIATGLLLARGVRPLRPLLVLVLVSALIGWTVSLTLSGDSTGRTVGRAIAVAAHPHDTIVNLYGHADLVQASGLDSPYEHLWSLPIKTSDPHLTELDAVLAGPQAPTWLVTGDSVASWGLSTTATQHLIDQRYRTVNTICGRTVHELRTVERPVPIGSGGC